MLIRPYICNNLFFGGLDDKIAQGIFVPCYFVTDEETLGERNGWSYMKEKEER